MFRVKIERGHRYLKDTEQTAEINARRTTVSGCGVHGNIVTPCRLEKLRNAVIRVIDK